MSNNSKGSVTTIGRRSFISAISAAGLLMPIAIRNSTGFFDIFTGSRSKILVFPKPLIWLGFEELATFLSEAGTGGINLIVRLISRDVEKVKQLRSKYML